MEHSQNRTIVLSGLLILLVYSVFLNAPYIHSREFQGEEGRRVMVAKNMLKNDSWVLPTIGEKPYLRKPPVYNWILAGIFKLSGSTSEAAARSSSLIAAFLTAVLISLFWRKLAKDRSLWFVLPGIVLLTFIDVISKAVRAEIDMTFTLFNTAAILSWFHLHENLNKKKTAWIVALAFVGVAVLTKGPQPPAFFYGAVVLYLAAQRRFRELFSPGHYAGIAVALLICLCWIIPLLYEVEFHDLIRNWFGEVYTRRNAIKGGGFIRHFLMFPIDYISAYMPWIPFILLWKGRSLQDDPQEIRNITVFCIAGLVSSVPVYWLLPGARIRYLMPTVGFITILISIVLRDVLSGRVSQKKEIWAKRYFRVIFAAVFIGLLSAPLWGVRYGAFGLKSGIVPMLLFALLMILSVAGFYVKDRPFPRQLILFMIIVLVVKIYGASFFFPWYSENKSYYRQAAAEVMKVVPRGAVLYDYGSENPNMDYYLESEPRRIWSIAELADKPGAILLTRKSSLEKNYLPPSFKLLKEIPSRAEILMIYRQEGR